MKNTTEFQAKERDVFYESPEKILIDFFEPMQHPGHLVRRFHQICVAVFLHAAKDYTLTPVQFATLLAAEHYPGIDQTSISKIVALDRQTTSSVVTRLHERGLLEKVRKHKRTNAITITKKENR